jgi:hypothetical protein
MEKTIKVSEKFLKTRKRKLQSFQKKFTSPCDFLQSQAVISFIDNLLEKK